MFHVEYHSRVFHVEKLTSLYLQFCIYLGEANTNLKSRS
jgi:hypothetical protein